LNSRLAALKERVRNGAHHYLRRSQPITLLDEYQVQHLSWMQRVTHLGVRQCQAEEAHILPDERILYTRTLPAEIPKIYSDVDFQRLVAGRTLHEDGPVNNISPDWGRVLSRGLLQRRQAALQSIERFKHDPQKREFLTCAVACIDAVLDLAARYAQAARASGNQEMADILLQVPAHPPRSFHEALQSLFLLHSVPWLSGHYQIGFGRFDQYMWPYLEADLHSGRLDMSQAEDLLAEFFIALNKNSDLYPGVQQGDNGQTITLGGVDREGYESVNPLTYMALRVSRDLCLIDPKINLRITAHTKLDLLSQASELTSKGIGFPQYSNDDVVIPALVSHAYRLEDARDYAVAACWEFIIPGHGMDVVNIGAVSFPHAVDQALHTALTLGEDMPFILKCVKSQVRSQVNKLMEAYEHLVLPPAPMLSVLMEGCLESGTDISQGARYNNFGIHGAGAANAADALAAVQQLLFSEHRIQPGALLRALDADFEGFEGLRRMLADESPKVGNDDPRADEYLVDLFDMLAEACEDYGSTSRGGILRPGSGTAMYYIWLAAGNAGMREPLVGATAEGRRSGEPLAANLAPALGARVGGPFSLLLSFSKLDYRRICNGGPITMELADSVFRNPEAIRKVAMLVRAFAQMGCQQLQLNSQNAETLRAAQQNPEQYRNLIVRVWGWSGYFCELSPEYQDQIIARHLFALS